MSPNGRNLCLIVGHYKSGSTWLANILSLHPQIRGVSETHVFRYASKADDFRKCTKQIFSYGAWADGGAKRMLRRKLANWSRPVRVLFGLAGGQSALSWHDRPTTRHDLNLMDQLVFQRRLGKSKSADDYCQTFFHFLSSRLRPEKYLLEKTPTNVFEVPTIRRIFPEAKLIAIYRDGRDVAVSDKFHMEREARRQTTVQQSALKWRTSMEAQQMYRDKFDILCLSYESLLELPQPVIERLLGYLELSFDPETVSDMIQKSSFEFVTGRQRGNEARSFYRKGVVGDWANYFDDEDKRQFSEVAGDMLVEMGYEQDREPSKWTGAHTAALT